MFCCVSAVVETHGVERVWKAIPEQCSVLYKGPESFRRFPIFKKTQQIWLLLHGS